MEPPFRVIFETVLVRGHRPLSRDLPPVVGNRQQRAPFPARHGWPPTSAFFEGSSRRREAGLCNMTTRWTLCREPGRSHTLTRPRSFRSEATQSSEITSSSPMRLTSPPRPSFASCP
jgi:hypothetical protein